MRKSIQDKAINGGGVTQRLRHWICNLEVISSNPTPSHHMNLCSAVLNSTPPHLVTSASKPVGIFNKFSLLFTIFVSSYIVSPISTAVLLKIHVLRH